MVRTLTIEPQSLMVDLVIEECRKMTLQTLSASMSCPHEEVGYLLLKKELTVVGVIMDVVLIMAIMAKAIIKAVEIFKLI